MNVIEQLHAAKIIAVLRAKDIETGFELAKAIIQGGINAIEVAFTIPKAESLIRQLNETYGKDIILGAGTVLDEQMCEKAIQAGATYIVSPGFDLKTAHMCHKQHIPYIPGCMTVTEMMTALSNHVEVIKLFPGEHFGPSFIKSIKAPLPDLKVMVTGGVDLDNLKAWFEAGADMVGIGGALTKYAATKAYDQVTQSAQSYLQQIKEV